jgi:hypothetical protein
VPRIKKNAEVALFVVSALGVGLTLMVYALFHGYFDRGLFEVKEKQWSPSNKIAMIAERSDHEAMSSYTYFVVIGDHSFSPSELRHAYYSDAVIFAAAKSCLTLHWESPSKLVVGCNDSSLVPDDIDVQKRQSGEIFISYANIPIK